MLGNRNSTIEKKIPWLVFDVLRVNRHNPISIDNEIHEWKLPSFNRIIVLNSKEEVEGKRVKVEKKEYVILFSVYVYLLFIANLSDYDNRNENIFREH